MPDNLSSIIKNDDDDNYNFNEITSNAYIISEFKYLDMTCPSIKFEKNIYSEEIENLSPILISITHDLVSLSNVLSRQKSRYLMSICFNIWTRAALIGNIDAMYNITTTSFTPAREEMSKILIIEGINDLDYHQIQEELSQKLEKSENENDFIEVIEEIKNFFKIKMSDNLSSITNNDNDDNYNFNETSSITEKEINNTINNAYIISDFKYLDMTCPSIKFEKNIYSEEIENLSPILISITHDLVSLSSVLSRQKSRYLMSICFNIWTRAALIGNIDAMYNITTTSFTPAREEMSKILIIEGINDLDYHQIQEELSQKLEESENENDFIDVIEKIKQESLKKGFQSYTS
eukprot:jgi/Orpsp1_1/1176120/evm.model.c7180000056487.1